MSKLNVQAVFGKFATQVNGQIKMFDTESEANAAAILEEREAEFLGKATAYTSSLDDKSDKQVKQIQNVVIGYLAYEASAQEVEVEAKEVPATAKPKAK